MKVVHRDFKLLERWSQGDAAAGDALARRHYPSVFRFFEVRLPTAAEDLTQKTFLALVEAIERRSLHTSFRSYLFGIARNQMLMYLRRASRQDALRSFATDGAGSSKRTSLTAVFAKSEEQKLLLHALVALPADLQVAMQLYYWDELSTREIAEVFDVPASTITSRLARGRTLIRQHLTAIKVRPELQASIGDNIPHWARSLVKSQG